MARVASIALRFVVLAVLSLLLAGCGGGCEYDSENEAAGGANPIQLKLDDCGGDDKKCFCDAYDELIAFYEEVADKCDDLNTHAEMVINSVKDKKAQKGCESTMVAA